MHRTIPWNFQQERIPILRDHPFSHTHTQTVVRIPTYPSTRKKWGLHTTRGATIRLLHKRIPFLALRRRSKCLYSKSCWTNSGKPQGGTSRLQVGWREYKTPGFHTANTFGQKNGRATAFVANCELRRWISYTTLDLSRTRIGSSAGRLVNDLQPLPAPKECWNINHNVQQGPREVPRRKSNLLLLTTTTTARTTTRRRYSSTAQREKWMRLTTTSLFVLFWLFCWATKHSKCGGMTRRDREEEIWMRTKKLQSQFARLSGAAKKTTRDTRPPDSHSNIYIWMNS